MNTNEQKMSKPLEFSDFFGWLIDFQGKKFYFFIKIVK